jgi:glycerol-3-phosphate dehydrogenase
VNRDELLAQVKDRSRPWDVVVIGGGATGLGIAVDAAARGYDVALFEQSDFAKGTSSRSTKLVHGGVRYLQQGNVALVMEALKERGLMRRNAPHLVFDLGFVVPSYEWWESPFYGIGLKVYDMLAGRYGFGKSRHLDKDEVQAAIPSIRTEGLRGGTLYYDGQFDDARLALNLAQTAWSQGAALLNYAAVVALRKDESGMVDGVVVRDEESGAELEAAARVVVNATGPFTDGVRRLDHADSKPIVAASQGVHVVLDKSFLPGERAIMVPHTRDGRVMFAIPWHDVAVVGTTDTPIEEVDLEPRPLPGEIDFILETANDYLARPATRADLKSVFAGIRPLVTAGGDVPADGAGRPRAGGDPRRPRAAPLRDREPSGPRLPQQPGALRAALLLRLRRAAAPGADARAPRAGRAGARRAAADARGGRMGLQAGDGAHGRRRIGAPVALPAVRRARGGGGGAGGRPAHGDGAGPRRRLDRRPGAGLHGAGGALPSGLTARQSAFC